MPQKSMSEMSHKPDRMAEEVDYALREMKVTAEVMSDKIEKSLTFEDIKVLMTKAEESLTLKDLRPIFDKIETLVSKKDFMDLVTDYSERVVNCPTNDEIVDSITILSQKVDALKDAMISLTQKIDSEDVTNLDTDYESTIDANSI